MTPLRLRLLVASIVGTILFAVCLVTGYGQFCDSVVRSPQSVTMRDIDLARAAIETYRQEKRPLPKQLRAVTLENDYIRTDKSGDPIDWWKRPLHYWTDGSHYRVTSCGRDGKLGGVGFDYDLSSDDLGKYQSLEKSSRWHSDLPRGSKPTFWQFLQYRGEYSSGRSGSMLPLSCLLTGLLAFILAYNTIKHSQEIQRNTMGTVMWLLMTMFVTLAVGMFIVGLHIPSGH